MINSSIAIRFIISILLCVGGVCAQELYINEFLASNAGTNINPDHSDFVDWVEIYNAGDQELDLGGYYLTDNFNTPTEWRIPPGSYIPPKGFIVFWTDDRDMGRHTNFKLSRDGDEIALFDPYGVVVDSLSFHRQLPDVSMGRETDGSVNWVYFGEPTPGGNNSTNASKILMRAPAPDLNIKGGFFGGGQVISLNSKMDSTIIRYTTDGSLPTSTSTRYTEAIPLSRTTVLRARTFHKELLPSPVITHTYFINVDQTLPTFSFSTDPDYFWDDEIGIAVNGMDCNDPTEANSCQSWERPVHVEYFESSGKLALSEGAGIQVRGTQSCFFPRKQYGLYARSKYGASELEYQFFKDKYIGLFKRLVLKPGGADGLGNVYRGTMFRDEMITTLVKDRMDLDYSACQPTVVYINGEYLGIHNMRERIKQYYLSSNHGLDRDKIDIIESQNNGGVFQGEDQHYLSMLGFIESNDMSISENYAYVNTQMDMDEFINYQIVHLYIANAEWGNTNIQCWRPQSINGRWRWVLWDLEGGYDSQANGSSHYSQNTFGYDQDNLLKHRTLFERLLNNPEFRGKFIQRFAVHLNTTFHPDRVEAVIDSLKSLIKAEMPRDLARWSGECQDGCGVPFHICNIASYSDWEDNIDRMLVFAQERPSWMRQFISEKFALPGTVNLSLDVAQHTGGRLQVNGVDVGDSLRGLVFRDHPLTITALPDVGYEFVEWQGASTAKTHEIALTLSAEAHLTAVFKPIDAQILASEVHESMKLTKGTGPYLAQGDVLIADYAELVVEPGVEIRMPKDANIIVHGGLKIMGSELEPVRITNNTDYGADSWGAICYMNPTYPVEIHHAELIGPSHGRDPESQKAAISGLNTWIILRHVTIEGTDLPVYTRNCDLDMSHVNIRTNIEFGDFVNVRAGTARIKNCVFNGPPGALDVDAIDLDEVLSGLIEGNQFYGINGDAIDIGEFARNVVIKGNRIFDSADKGISIGEQSHAIVENNLIVGCLEGIAIKDSSYAIINQNTLHRNQTAIATYEKTLTWGGASSVVVNSILSSSEKASYRTDKVSQGIIAYSLSDTDLLPGNGNIFGLPRFIQYGNTEYFLDELSPCVDAGTARFILDGDTLIDMDEDSYTGIAPDLGAFELGLPTSISTKGHDETPSAFSLSNNYPNPFNPITTIRYKLPKNSNVDLVIYDVTGREIKTLVNHDQPAGQYQVQWDGLDDSGNQVGGGIYLCQLITADYSKTTKMMYLK